MTELILTFLRESNENFDRHEVCLAYAQSSGLAGRTPRVAADLASCPEFGANKIFGRSATCPAASRPTLRTFPGPNASRILDEG